MIRSVCKLLTIVVGLGWASSAGAMMLKAQDYFRSTTDQEAFQIRSALQQLPAIDFANARILILEREAYTFYLRYKLIIIRFENMCTRDNCVSAIFMENIDTEHFQGIVFLPAKMTVGDIIGPVCDRCGNGITYIFEAPDGGSRSITLTEFGPMF
jgi:hypothetical protein